MEQRAALRRRLLLVLLEVAFFALWRELPFFAGAKKRNPKKAPLEAKPLVSFCVRSKNDCWLQFDMRHKSAAITFYTPSDGAAVVLAMRPRTAKVALLLETFSLVTFFDVNQRKLPAPQRGTHNIREE